MHLINFFYNKKNRPVLDKTIDGLDEDKLWRFRIDLYDKKTRAQEEKYHAMLGDIARQSTHLNQHLSADDWKRLCVDMFAKECISQKQELDKLADYFMKNPVRLIPSLDGSGLVALGAQTRKFPKYVASAFIEWLYSFGAERNVVWTTDKRGINDRL